MRSADLLISSKLWGDWRYPTERGIQADRIPYRLSIWPIVRLACPPAKSGWKIRFERGNAKLRMALTGSIVDALHLVPITDPDSQLLRRFLLTLHYRFFINSEIPTLHQNSFLNSCPSTWACSWRLAPLEMWIDADRHDTSDGRVIRWRRHYTWHL